MTSTNANESAKVIAYAPWLKARTSITTESFWLSISVKNINKYITLSYIF